MLIVTENMFVRIMCGYSSSLFSKEALKLIYDYLTQDESSIEFREMDVELGFDEMSYLDCISDNDIIVEGIEDATSEYEKIKLEELAISKTLGHNLIGFTSRDTVVCKSRR